MYPPIKHRIEKEFSFCLKAVIEKLDNDLPEKPFFSIKEVAELFGVSKKTVRRWVNTGKIHAYKMDTGWRISRKELLEFVAEKSNWLLP